MSVATVKDRLKALQETISGITRAYDNGPGKLPMTDLPCFVNFTGPMQYDSQALGEGFARETRLYVMRLYVRTAPAGKAIDGDDEAACEPFFPLVRDLFAARRMLGLNRIDTGLPGVDATYLGDNGVQVMNYAGQDYIGIEFRLQVQESVTRTRGTGE